LKKNQARKGKFKACFGKNLNKKEWLFFLVATTIAPWRTFAAMTTNRLLARAAIFLFF
jgi:hypothetical protein